MNRYFLVSILALILISFSMTNDLSLQNSETIDLILSSYMDKSPKILFKVFHLLFKKDYEFTSELAKTRYQNFKINLAYIKETNSQNLDYNVGINQFSDLSLEEFKAKYLKKKFLTGKELDEATKNFIEFVGDDEDDDDLTKRNLSKSKSEGFTLVDWSKFYSTVRDQANCASCWTFANTAIVEGCLAIKQGKPYQLLSTQQLLDCDTDQSGCDGGDLISDINFVKSKGLMADKAYPYLAYAGSCKYAANKVVAKITGVKHCSNYKKKGSCTAAIVNTMLQNGPIAVGIDGGTNAFMYYKSGVFNARCSQDNHAVALIGYGVDPKAGDYWLIRNSWGTWWGMKGYGKIKNNDANKFSCFVTNEAIQAVC